MPSVCSTWILSKPWRALNLISCTRRVGRSVCSGCYRRKGLRRTMPTLPHEVENLSRDKLCLIMFKYGSMELLISSHVSTVLEL